jgi:L-ascorbate metabolism protein UlaG (beta-lactamase superfamily)
MTDRASTFEYNGMSFWWPGYSTIRITTESGHVVYLDPGRVDYGVLTDVTPHDADTILISHSHHYDPKAIQRVSNPDTVVFVLDDVRELNNLGNRTPDQLLAPTELKFETHCFEYEDTFDFNGIHVQTVPAYNYPTPRGMNITSTGQGLHEPGTCVGFHLTIDGLRVFWPSDTDLLDEHADLDVDVLFPPISRLATMNRHEAVELVTMLEPDLVVPVHYMFEDKTPKAGFHIAADPHAFKAEVDKCDLDVRCELI